MAGKPLLRTISMELADLMKNGIVSMKDLQNGIEIDQKWIRPPQKNEEGYDGDIKPDMGTDISVAMAEQLKKINPSYFTDRNNGQPPTQMKKIVIKLIGKNGLAIAVTGSDRNATSFIISSQDVKEKETKVPVVTPSEFIALCADIEKDKMIDSIFKELVENNDLNKYKREDKIKKHIAAGLVGEQPKNILFVQKYLRASWKHAISKYKEHILEKRKQEEETQKKEIAGGTVLQGKSTGNGGGTPGGLGTSPKERTNEKIEEEVRFEALEKMLGKDDHVVIYNTESETETKGECRAYVYNAPAQNGVLIICEPSMPTISTRLAFIPDDKLEKGPRDEEYWKKLTKQYLEPSREEFLDLPRTRTINHADKDNYIEAIQSIVEFAREGKTKKEISTTTKARIYNVRRALFEGTKKPNIKGIVKEVTEEEIDEARRALQPVKNKDKKQNPKGRKPTSDENPSGAPGGDR